jgi:hypothetical protein
MSDDGSGLPQAVIDEMFIKQSAKQNNTLPEASAAVLPDSANELVAEGGAVTARPPQQIKAETPSITAAPPVTPVLDNETLEIMRQTMIALTEQTAKMEARLHQLEQKQNTTAEFGAAILQLEEKLEVITRYSREIDSRVITLLSKLQDTPSYGVRSDFTCESCGSQGFAAIPLRCTNCGKEGWWGWWPNHKE